MLAYENEWFNANGVFKSGSDRGLFEQSVIHRLADVSDGE
jgi:hypothetical protein